MGSVGGRRFRCCEECQQGGIPAVFRTPTSHLCSYHLSLRSDGQRFRVAVKYEGQDGQVRELLSKPISAKKAVRMTHEYRATGFVAWVEQ